MIGGKVLDYDKRNTGVGRSVFEEFFEGLKAAGGRAQRCDQALIRGRFTFGHRSRRSGALQRRRYNSRFLESCRSWFVPRHLVRFSSMPGRREPRPLPIKNSTGRHPEEIGFLDSQPFNLSIGKAQRMRMNNSYMNSSQSSFPYAGCRDQIGTVTNIPSLKRRPVVSASFLFPCG